MDEKGLVSSCAGGIDCLREERSSSASYRMRRGCVIWEGSRELGRRAYLTSFIVNEYLASLNQ